MSTDAQREAVARALYEGVTGNPWDAAEILGDDRERYYGHVDEIIAAYEAAAPLRPLSDWHEDDSFALWWTLPVEEPPYVGSPLCSDWPGYHTHFTPLPMLPKDPAP